MGQGLKRCTRLVGTAVLSPGRPSSRIVTDALYLPEGTPGGWGLHGPEGCVDGADQGRGALAAFRDAAACGAHADPECRYLYIGLITGHFGHFIIDCLSRFWPVLEIADRPRIRLLHQGTLDAAEHGFVAEMLAGLGLARDALVAFDRPTILPRVLVPERSFVGTTSAHRCFADLCRTIGRRYYTQDTVDSEERPVYLSKLKLRGASLHKIENEDRLAAALERRGVEIVSPEDLSFPDQVRLFATRTRILGAAGSALHTSLFAAPRRNVVALNWCRYLNANFVLFDKLNDNRACYLYPQGAVSTQDADYLGTAGYFLRWTIPDPDRAAADLLRHASTTGFGAYARGLRRLLPGRI